MLLWKIFQLKNTANRKYYVQNTLCLENTVFRNTVFITLHFKYIVCRKSWVCRILCLISPKKRNNIQSNIHVMLYPHNHWDYEQCQLKHTSCQCYLEACKNSVPQEPLWSRIHACAWFIHQHYTWTTNHRHGKTQFTSCSSRTVLALFPSMLLYLKPW